MPFKLPDLPYATDALAPVISPETISYHHGKHHAAYATNLNGLLEGTGLENLSLDDLLATKEKWPEAKKTGIYNNAAQVWNHTFYWNSLKPNGGGLPTGEIAKKIDTDFGSYDNFAKELKESALGQFGSGWAWLVLKNGKLSISKTSNADTPIAHGVKPILCIDVWEHAYYLEFQNRRADYVNAVLDKLINWSFAADNLELSGKIG